MLHRAAAAAFVFLGISSTAFAQDLDSRQWYTQELTRKAQEAIKRGDQRSARAYMAESLAVWADILWDKGEVGACEKHFWDAREMGWAGPPPWGRDRHVWTFTPPKQDERIPVPVPEPIRRPTAPRESAKEIDYWELAHLAPPSSSRNGVWHGLLGIPPFEDASVLPVEVWVARARLEMSAGDFEDTSGGNQSLWDAVLVEETLQVDYGIFDGGQVGLRLTLGELLESGSSAIRVFEGGTQIVPTGRRHWGPGELVLRGKVAFDLEGWSLGGLAEVKVPLADGEDLLTSGTIDLGLMGLLTYRHERWGFHANLGMVVPAGNADLFEPEEDPSPFAVFAVGVSYRAAEPLVVTVLVDGNTSAWGDVSVIDEPVIGASLAMRWRITERVVLGAGLRIGVGELSGGAGFFGGVELAW